MHFGVPSPILIVSLSMDCAISEYSGQTGYDERHLYPQRSGAATPTDNLPPYPSIPSYSYSHTERYPCPCNMTVLAKLTTKPSHPSPNLIAYHRT